MTPDRYHELVQLTSSGKATTADLVELVRLCNERLKSDTLPDDKVFTTVLNLALARYWLVKRGQKVRD